MFNCIFWINCFGIYFKNYLMSGVIRAGAMPLCGWGLTLLLQTATGRCPFLFNFPIYSIINQ